MWVWLRFSFSYIGYGGRAHWLASRCWWGWSVRVWGVLTLVVWQPPVRVERAFGIWFSEFGVFVVFGLALFGCSLLAQLVQ